MTINHQIVTYTMPLAWAEVLAEFASHEVFFELTKDFSSEEAEGFAEKLCCGALLLQGTPLVATDEEIDLVLGNDTSPVSQ